MTLFRIHKEFNQDRFKSERKTSDIDEALGGL